MFPRARRARTGCLSSAKPTQGGSLNPRRLGRRRWRRVSSRAPRRLGRRRREFAEGLCEEMLANTVDGVVVYGPSRGLKRPRPMNGTVLASYGRKSDRDESVKGTKQNCSIQRPYTVCGKKTNHYCTRAEYKRHHRARNMTPPYLALLREFFSLLMCAGSRAYQRPHGKGRRGSAAVPSLVCLFFFVFFLD